MFLTPAWLHGLQEKLNSDPQYAHLARNWEGDLTILVEPDGPLPQPLAVYFDLWHGQCRAARFLGNPSEQKAAFTITTTYGNIRRVLTAELDVMQAFLTRKLKLEGSMTYIMRNVPVVLDFVRCAKEATASDAL